MLKRVSVKCCWGSLLSLLALGTPLALAQQEQPVPKTRVAKAAPAASIAAPPAGSAGAGAGAAQADESPWAKLCTKNEQTGNKQICLVQHGGLDPETGIVLGTAAVRSVEGEDKQNLRVGLTTNYSLVLPVGVQIQIDDSEPILLQYILCFGTNCQAQTELTKENFDKMRKGKQMTVAAITMQQQRIGFPVPLTGFGTAYDGPPVDNAKYEDAWRQLMEKSRQRQIDANNKGTEQNKERSTQQPQAEAPPQAGVQVPIKPPAH